MGTSQTALNSLRQLLKAITPHGLVELRRRRFQPPAPASAISERDRFHDERRQKIADATRRAPRHGSIDGTNRSEVIKLLLSRGVPLHHLNEGSVPEASLAFLRTNVLQLLPASEPLLALHIGNFVGVSLAYVAATLKELHPESLTIAIDPNLPHRGVANPQEHVAVLLSACELQRSTLLIAGYSGKKSVSNDGVDFGGYDPAKTFAAEAACERTLGNLRQFLAKRSHLVMMDGNHEGKYLEAEILEVVPLMARGGLLVFDDVDEAWDEIRDVFKDVEKFGLKSIGTDGRIGIAQVL